MSYSLPARAVFGSHYSGLSSVGYTIFDDNGILVEPRNTNSIMEVSAEPGTYLTNIDFSTPFSGEIRWDIGGTNPVTATAFITYRDFTLETPIVPTAYPILPAISGFKSGTNLNSPIKSYTDLAARVKRLLGWPTVNIEVCDENIYEYINQALEWYTKYAGFTTEYLVFSSDLYQPGLGVKLDKLFSFTPEMYTLNNGLSGSYDYDLNSYRKVVDVFSVAEGENTGINTLFTLEQGMMQQVYSTFMLGTVGFDLVTWHILKNWLNDREKMLGAMVYFRFNPNTQYLRLIPEPRIASTQGGVTLNGGSYYGLIGCYVEKPINELIHERWVQRYVLALTKITLGHIRGKFQGTTLFGGGTVNSQDMMAQGLDEKQKLEDELMTGHGEVEPAMFFIG